MAVNEGPDAPCPARSYPFNYWLLGQLARVTSGSRNRLTELRVAALYPLTQKHFRFLTTDTAMPAASS